MNDSITLTIPEDKFATIAASDFTFPSTPDNEAHRLSREASALFDVGDYAGAEALFEKAHAVSPSFAEAAKNLAAMYLMRGEFEKAWPLFLARFVTSADSTMFDTGIPADGDMRIWDGRRVASGKVLMIWGEQGLGEQILFASMLHEMHRMNMTCALVCEHRLVPLFARSFPWLVVVAAGSVAMPQYDCQIIMGELGRYLRGTRERFHGAKSWLVASPTKSTEFRKRVTDGRRIVGISWHSARPEDGAAKSVPLDMVQALVGAHDMRWVNLQHGPERGRLTGALIDGDTTNDIDGLAAQLKALDLFITASNTTAHLAAALGVRTWLLEPRGRGARWYWGTPETPSPWYPHVRVFHQTTPGDWTTVMASVDEALHGW